MAGKKKEDGASQVPAEDFLAGADEAAAEFEAGESEESPEEANKRLGEILAELDPGLLNPKGIDEKPFLERKLPQSPVPGHPKMENALQLAEHDRIGDVLKQGSTLPTVAVMHGQDILIPAAVRDVPNRLHCDRKKEVMAFRLINAVFGHEVVTVEEKNPYGDAVKKQRAVGLGPAVRTLAGKGGFSEKPWVWVSSKLYELLKAGVADVHNPKYESEFSELDEDEGNAMHAALQLVFSGETIRDLKMLARHEDVGVLDSLRAIFANYLEAHKASIIPTHAEII